MVLWKTLHVHALFRNLVFNNYNSDVYGTGLIEYTGSLIQQTNKPIGLYRKIPEQAHTERERGGGDYLENNLCVCLLVEGCKYVYRPHTVKSKHIMYFRFYN